MKLSNVALVSTVALLGIVAVGCAAKKDDGGESLGVSESLLVDDSNEGDDADDTMESGVEEPLSGAEPTDPGTPADGADEATLLGKIKSNPGKWFQPAGCIATTLTGNVAKHVFKGCKGPYGLVDFDGTVTSTYVLEGGTLTVTHEASGFKANGAQIEGKRVVVYTRSGSVVTKHRTGSWSGTTKKGKAFTHEADFTVTWDAAAKCITRDGSAQTTIATREVSHTIAGYKRCGIGNLGCPESGTITLSRTKGDKSASVTLVFEGGRDVTITGPNGRSITRQLVCNP
ncbi:MAG TPA: hypothetical protein VLT33_38315 [Labilithrix sp.]|jgi:hypothetical protein|nr:hypothetical protein [Labilithrix sp.]